MSVNTEGQTVEFCAILYLYHYISCLANLYMESKELFCSGVYYSVFIRQMAVSDVCIARSDCYDIVAIVTASIT